MIPSTLLLILSIWLSKDEQEMQHYVTQLNNHQTNPQHLDDNDKGISIHPQTYKLLYQLCKIKLSKYMTSLEEDVQLLQQPPSSYRQWLAIKQRSTEKVFLKELMSVADEQMKQQQQQNKENLEQISQK